MSPHARLPVLSSLFPLADWHFDPFLLPSGIDNSVVESEVHAMSEPTGSKENWAGNGFYSVKKELKTTAEGARDADQNASRMWTMVNPNKTHYSSGAPIGYKIMCKDTAPLLAHDDSLVGRRATFAKHTIWTTPYVDGQLFPAGKFPTQTPFAPKDSLEFWMEGERNIANTDVVTWLQFGTTHIPRPEDWPVVSRCFHFGADISPMLTSRSRRCLTRNARSCSSRPDSSAPTQPWTFLQQLTSTRFVHSAVATCRCQKPQAAAAVRSFSE